MKNLNPDELLSGAISAQTPSVRAEEEKKGITDLATVLQKGLELFSEQAQLGTHPQFQDLEGIALSEAKATAFLNAINNAVSVSHLANIAQATDRQFQRTKEMEVYNPLLNSFADASSVVERKMSYVARQMHYTMEKLEEYERQGLRLDYLGSVNPNLVGNVPGVGSTKKDIGMKKQGGQNWFETEDVGFVIEEEEEQVPQVPEFAPGQSPAELLMHIDGLQYMFDKSMNNMAQLTTGIDKLVQSERHSGARPWGNSKGGIPSVTQPIAMRPRRDALPNGGGREKPLAIGGNRVGGSGSVESGPVVREMTVEELGEVLLRQTQDGGGN